MRIGYITEGQVILIRSQHCKAVEPQIGVQLLELLLRALGVVCYWMSATTFARRVPPRDHSRPVDACTWDARSVAARAVCPCRASGHRTGREWLGRARHPEITPESSAHSPQWAGSGEGAGRQMSVG